jgi:hypothetical protein
MNMKIIDTPSNTENKAAALAANGVGTVIRYYNFSNSRTLPDKCLTLAEAQALAEAGLQIGTVFQQQQNKVEHFSKAKGIAAGTRAYRYAYDNIGQPSESGVYFSVDFDASDSDLSSSIIPFFEGVKTAFEKENDGSTQYRVGAYGSGLVCSTLSKHGLTDLTWLAMSRGFRGTRDAVNKGEFHLLQKPGEETLLGLDVDFNELNPQRSDFGAFIIEAEQPPRDATVDRVSAQPFRIIARSGLRLRSGPGIEFDIIGNLAPDQTVFVSSVRNGWARVDIQGDGRVDGFAYESFLERV